MKKLFVCVVLFWASFATATDITWTGSGANNDWLTAANWSTGTAPFVVGDAAFIPYVTGYQPIITTNVTCKLIRMGYAADNFNDSILTIATGGSLTTSLSQYIKTSYEAGGCGIINVSGTLTTRLLVIAGEGNNSRGAVNVTGGTVNISTTSSYTDVRMGEKSGHGVATFSVSDNGTVNMNHNGLADQYLSVGYYGSTTAAESLCQFNLSSGTLNMNNATSLTNGGAYLAIARGTGTDNAEFNLSGTGTVNMVSTVSAGKEVLAVGFGTSSSGTFNQTGGTVNISNGGGGSAYLSVGHGTDSTGVYNFSAGQLNTTATNIGSSGTGTLNISGSANLNNSTNIKMGANSGGKGILNMSGGTLDVATYLTVGHTSGSLQSEFNLSGGTVNINSLEVGRGAAGKLTITGSAAEITVDALYVGGNSTGSYGTGTIEFKVDASGVSVIQAVSSVNLDPGVAESIANLIVTLTAVPLIGDILLIDNQGTSAISGAFDALNGGSATEGAEVVLSFGGVNYAYTLTYVGGTGNDVVLMIPEPTTLAIFAVAGLFASFKRRR